MAFASGVDPPRFRVSRPLRARNNIRGLRTVVNRLSATQEFPGSIPGVRANHPGVRQIEFLTNAGLSVRSESMTYLSTLLEREARVGRDTTAA